MAFLDLVDLGEVAGEVCGDRAGHLLDEDERQDPIAEQHGVDEGRVAADHASSLELLHPLVGRGTAHPDCLPDFGIRLTPVALQQLEDSSVCLVDPFG